MNTAVQQIARELADLRAEIRANGGTPTRPQRALLRDMRDRLNLARKGIVR
ncbi:hypothetical protein [Isoptericola sp. NPDC056134]|uniref:hypothetical protein n=1 Tax=Isoptericola sp. NPDC056134 TaxID=3345723 RepID=UPI0035F016EA